MRGVGGGRFGGGGEEGGDWGMGESRWRFGEGEQWCGNLDMGTSVVEIWVWGPESVIFTERYWYHCLCF